jgi:hypothetical protein
MGGMKAVAQRYSVVKIPCAERGDTRTQLLSKRQGLTKREMRLEDQTKEQIRKKSVQYVITKMQNKKIFGVEVASQCYSVTKLPRAERRVKRNIIIWIAGQGRKRKEIRRL